MSDDTETADGSKKFRSPNFPFISLRKAAERASAFYENHHREAARIQAIAPSWGYSPKSSGVLQTIAALKQFGLVDSEGSGDERKVQLTDLGIKLAADKREGARDAALREAVRQPAIFSEYFDRWSIARPSDEHCISELTLDRNFSPAAAKSFLRVFDESMQFAGIDEPVDYEEDEHEEDDATISSRDTVQPHSSTHELTSQSPTKIVPTPVVPKVFEDPGRPLKERLKVTFDSDSLAVVATLTNQQELESLIKSLNAMKGLLPESIDDLL